MVDVLVVWMKLVAIVMSVPLAFWLAEVANNWLDSRPRVQSRSAAQRLDGSKPEDVQ